MEEMAAIPEAVVDRIAAKHRAPDGEVTLLSFAQVLELVKRAPRWMKSQGTACCPLYEFRDTDFHVQISMAGRPRGIGRAWVTSGGRTLANYVDADRNGGPIQTLYLEIERPLRDAQDAENRERLARLKRMKDEETAGARETAEALKQKLGL